MEAVCGDGDKRDVRRPMNAFLIFCKRHRSIVREKNPDLDNRSVTRILGDLWANLKDSEKLVYTDLAKQYKDAFMKANPDYKWHNPEKSAANTQKPMLPKPTNAKVMKHDIDCLPEGSIMPGKLADPSNMGGLSLLLMAGQQSEDHLPISSSLVPDTTPSSLAPSSTTTMSQSADHLDNITSANLPVVSEKSTSSNVIAASSRNPRLKFPAKIEPSEKKGDSIVTKSWDTTVGKSVETTGVKVEIVKSVVKPVCEPVWNIDGKRIENQSRRESAAQGGQTSGDDAKGSHSLLELAEMCSSHLGPAKSAPKLVTATKAGKPPSGIPSKSTSDNPAKPLLYQAVAAPKLPQRSLLAEAFLDTSERGNNSDILKDNSSSTKKAWTESCDGISDGTDEKPKNSNDLEKENISKLVVTNMKEGKDVCEDELPMIKCGKFMVNHIIDKLFSSDIAMAARKVANSQPEKNDMDKDQNADVKTEQVRNEIALNKGTSDKIVNSRNGAGDFDEHDGNLKNPKKQIDETKCLSGSRVEKIVTEEIYKVHKVDKNEVDSVQKMDSEVKHDADVDAEKPKSEVDSADLKQPGNRAETARMNRKRSSVSVSSSNDGDLGHGEEELDGEFQPIRKSRRRNRGQRYQELIAEGIIQPSKERIAAQQQTPRDDGCEEDFQSIDTYILPETAMRRIRKRTTSESAKDKIIPLDDPKRYKTGDFDLEAHIATLPACTVESMGRKRGFNRQRHNSETTFWRKPAEDQAPVTAFDLEKAVSLPPHMKIPTPEKSQEPVVGSRKRKARKHSITHLLPAPIGVVAPGTAKATEVNDNPETDKVSDEVETKVMPADDMTVSSSDLKRLADTTMCKAPSDMEDSMIPDVRLGCTDANSDGKIICEAELQESSFKYSINCSKENCKSSCEKSEGKGDIGVDIVIKDAKNVAFHKTQQEKGELRTELPDSAAEGKSHSLKVVKPHSEKEAKLCQPHFQKEAVIKEPLSEIQNASLNSDLKPVVCISKSVSQSNNNEDVEAKCSAVVRTEVDGNGAGNSLESDKNDDHDNIDHNIHKTGDYIQAKGASSTVSGSFVTTCAAIGSSGTISLVDCHATFPRSECTTGVVATNFTDIDELSSNEPIINGSAEVKEGTGNGKVDLNCNNPVQF